MIYYLFCEDCQHQYIGADEDTECFNCRSDNVTLEFSCNNTSHCGCEMCEDLNHREYAELQSSMCL